MTMNSATALIKRTLSVSVLMSAGISAIGSYLWRKKDAQSSRYLVKNTLFDLKMESGITSERYKPLNEP